MEVMGYVVGNPLKHGIVDNFDQLQEYEFSSFSVLAKKFNRGYAESLVRNSIDLEF